MNSERRSRSLSESICLLNGRPHPFSELSIAPDDLGFRQGVTAVERLRTWHGKVWQPDRHLDRFERTCRGIGMAFDRSTWQADLQTLMDHNVVFTTALDHGITLLMTPGQIDHPITRIATLSPIDHTVADQRRDSGQPIEITPVQMPPPETWPRHWKVRSRLHYYLADQLANQYQTGAIGVLLDQDGSVTETSLCSLAIVVDGEILSPPPERILPSVTQAVVESLATAKSIPWRYRPIAPDEVRCAEEVLLMGTDTGLWFANQIDRGPKRVAGRVYKTLLSAWFRRVE